MGLKRTLAMTSLAVLSLLSTAPAAMAQESLVDRPAELRIGACDSLGDLVMPLAHLVVTLGDPQGQTAATPVEQSATVVPYTVTNLLAANHVVTVQKSPEQPDVLVACGVVGGTRNPDGTLAIGMLAVNDSGLSGIAYFTPNPGFDNTLITILLVTNDATTSDVSTSEPTEAS